MNSHAPASHNFAVSVLITVLVGAALIALPVYIAHAHKRKPRPSSAAASKPNQDSPRLARGTYGKLPLSFEANQGQADSQVKFLSRGAGYAFFLTNDGAVLSFLNAPRQRERAADSPAEPHSLRPSPHNKEASLVQREQLSNIPKPELLRMRYKGANISTQIKGINELPGKVNYLRGNQKEQWCTNVSTYARVRHENIYPNIDLVYYGNQRQLEYDFELAPGGDPRTIKLVFSAGRLRLDRRGNLRVKLGAEAVDFLKPISYQIIQGRRREIRSRYVLINNNEVTFEVGHYDRTQPLVIDPVLSYSTYVGGSSSEIGYGIAVDSAGSAYIVGQSSSNDFPGSAQTHDTTDAFVAKLNPAGTALLYTTFLGGNGLDEAYTVKVNSSGNAYVAGLTTSTNFPLVNAMQGTSGGSTDGFVAELAVDGSAFIYSTYLGGSTFDVINGLALDASNNVYLTGQTNSRDFPVASAFQSQNPGSAISKSTSASGLWNVSDSGLKASDVNGLAFDPTNPNAIFAATDAGVVKSTNSGSTWASIAPGQVPNFLTTIAIHPTDPTTIYVGGSGGVFKSTDGGNNFISSNTGLNITFLRSVVVNPSVPTTLFAGGVSSRIYRSTNAGSNWTGTNLTSVSSLFAIVVDPTNAMVVYAGSNRGVFKSTDGGTSWLSPPANNLISNSIRSLAIDRSNTSVLYAGTSVGIAKSTNAGLSWTDITGSGDYGTVSAVALDPANSSIVYYGTTSRIHKSTDAGATWSLMVNGYRQSIVHALLIEPVNTANIYAGTTSGSEAFLTKLNAAGSAKVFSTYLGGWLDDRGYGIAVDSSGNAYVSGQTFSDNFPTLIPIQATKGAIDDSFVAKFNNTGSALIYSTYLGGNSSELAWGLAVDGAGAAYVAGLTNSTNFPVANAFQPKNARESFFDAFVSKIDPSGSGLAYSTYLGGTEDDVAFAIAVNSQGNAFITGRTLSTDFPIANQVVNGNIGDFSGSAFVTKLDLTGSVLGYSTKLGGSQEDTGWAIAIDSSDRAYVSGATESEDFPTVTPFQSINIGFGDVFISRIATSPAQIRFQNSSFNVGEGAGSFLVTVVRDGDTSAAVKVDFATADQGATQKRDYTLAAGTLSFAVGETSKTFRILVTDNVYVDGERAVKLSLTNPVGADLSEPTVATLLIADNDTVPPATNPLDDPQFFVRQHYSDFLSRVPDQAGFDFWTGQITQCGSDQSCIRTRRIDVSNAFFYELEYQQTGSYVYRLYRAAFGNNQPFPNPNANAQFPYEEKKLPGYAAFAPDRARVRGGSSLAQTQLDLANAFVQRPAFLTKYPPGFPGSNFVDMILTTLSSEVGTDLSSQRQALIDLFNQGGRGAVLYRLADDNTQTNPINNRAFIDAEYNRAFVVTQYFGYLRRNPDIGGFIFWLGQVNSAALRDVAKQHAMVCSFITSAEYQLRFSSVVTHNNSECNGNNILDARRR